MLHLSRFITIIPFQFLLYRLFKYENLLVFRVVFSLRLHSCSFFLSTSLFNLTFFLLFSRASSQDRGNICPRFHIYPRCRPLFMLSSITSPFPRSPVSSSSFARDTDFSNKTKIYAFIFKPFSFYSPLLPLTRPFPSLPFHFIFSFFLPISTFLPLTVSLSLTRVIHSLFITQIFKESKNAFTPSVLALVAQMGAFPLFLSPFSSFPPTLHSIFFVQLSLPPVLTFFLFLSCNIRINPFSFYSSSVLLHRMLRFSRRQVSLSVCVTPANIPATILDDSSDFISSCCRELRIALQPLFRSFINLFGLTCPYKYFVFLTD